MSVIGHWNMTRQISCLCNHEAYPECMGQNFTGQTVLSVALGSNISGNF